MGFAPAEGDCGIGEGDEVGCGGESTSAMTCCEKCVSRVLAGLGGVGVGRRRGRRSAGASPAGSNLVILPER